MAEKRYLSTPRYYSGSGCESIRRRNETSNSLKSSHSAGFRSENKYDWILCDCLHMLLVSNSDHLWSFKSF